MDYASLESAIGLNWWDVDPNLQRAVRHHCPAEDLAWAQSKLSDFGALVGDRIARNADISEVELGLPLQGVPLELVRARLSKRHFERATVLAQLYDPDAAIDAGWVDQTIPEDEIIEGARVVAQRYAALPATAFARTKKQSRRILAETVRKMMEKGAKGSDVFSALRT